MPRINNSPVTNRKIKAFTLIELLVVIAIISLLAAILFPVFAQARAKARQSACLANTKQIGMALMMYGQDYDETLVLNDNGSNMYWYDILQPYLKNYAVLICPDYDKGNYGVVSPQNRRGTYVINNIYYGNRDLGAMFEHWYIQPLASIQDAAGTVFCGDGGLKGFSASYGPQVILDGLTLNLNSDPPTLSSSQGSFVGRHNRGLNVAFLDGHSKWLTLQELSKKNSAGNYPYFTKIAD